MKIRGYDVLVSKRSYKAWCRKNTFYPGSFDPEPTVHPCFVEEHQDSHENTYLSFVTLEDVSRMEKALQRANALISGKKSTGGGH